MKKLPEMIWDEAKGHFVMPKADSVWDQNELSSGPTHYLNLRLWEVEQFEYWEEQFRTNGPIVRPLNEAKSALLTWYLDNILPCLKSASDFPVLYFLLRQSPDDFTSFKRSNRSVAGGSGVYIDRVPEAVRRLEELGLIHSLNEPVFSMKGISGATIREYIVVPVGKLRRPKWPR
jgi:hypothetical protein